MFAKNTFLVLDLVASIFLNLTEGCIDQSYNENGNIVNRDGDGADDDKDDDDPVVRVPVARLFRVVER